MGLLDGKVAAVTGAAQGIGLAVATAFVQEGAAVVLSDVDAEAVQRSAEGLVDKGANAIAQGCDVRSEDDVTSVVQAAVDRFGSLDVMVNNAGITRDATMRKMHLDDFRMVIDVHLQGAWLGTRAAAAVMRERQAGSIINMSSISGKIGNPGQTNYSAAKAGIVGLTKAAAKELARFQVRVNAIQPGLIRTAMTAAMRPEIFDQKASEIPLGRVGEASDVANVALFLASELSSYMTGTVLEVSGGRHI